MHLYSITTILFLCLFALLCAPQEITDAGTSPPGLFAITDHRPPLNESHSPPAVIKPRRLFSRTNGEGKKSPSSGRPIGPVQEAWKARGPKLGSASSTVYEVRGGFFVGDRRKAAVIKRVKGRPGLEQRWMKLHLVYLKTVSQLLAHGRDEKGWYYIVMPYMGMSWAKARDAGMRLKFEGQKPKKKKTKEEMDKTMGRAMEHCAKGVATHYAKQFGIQNLDVTPQHMAFQKTANPPHDWVINLISWGYAQFMSQPQVPNEQQFSPYCQVDGHRPRDEQCVYWAVRMNLGEEVKKGSLMRYLKKNFLESPAIVRVITARTIQEHRTVHHEVMNQKGIGQFLAWASVQSHGPTSLRDRSLDSEESLESSESSDRQHGPERMYYYLVTKNMGVPAEAQEPQLSTSHRKLLRQKARDRYQKKFNLIYSEDDENNYVYRLEEGSKTEFEANIIDGWAFALPVGHADPGEPEIFIS